MVPESLRELQAGQMTIIADRLNVVANEITAAAGAYEALEAERDEYKRRLKIAMDIIEKHSLPMSFAERSDLGEAG